MPVPAPPARRRDDAVDRLPPEVDVLVIGGGITGAGVALDAAARGARVVLVDRGDLAQGTSSRSSRLVHGGARYLATGDVAMVAEGVRERDRLRRMAPHLVLPQPFVVTARSRVDLALLATGMTAYDGLAGGRGVARHHRLDAAGVLRAAPGLATGYASGGVRYWDCRTDDARLTLAVALAAADRGAVVAPHVEVTDLHRRGDRVVGASLRDVLGGRELTIGARWTVSAAGVWAGAVQRLDDAGSDLRVLPARGVHLVFDRDDLPTAEALVLPSAARDGRRLFVVPWGDQVYVGTTDVLHGGSLDAAALDETDSAYVLEATNAAFGTSLTAADAVGAWAGLRPLLAGRERATTADLSRRHAIVPGPDGLLTVTGGKLTTFRRMAADVVDVIARREGWRRRARTTRVRLGSHGDAAAGRAHLRLVAAASGLPLTPRLLDGLYHRHGDLAGAVLDSCVEHDELSPLVPGLPYLAGEVRWAARHELAGRLDDVLQRRLRVSTRHRAAGGAGPIRMAADVLAGEFGWSRERRDAEVAGYLDAVRVERGVVPLEAPTAPPWPSTA